MIMIMTLSNIRDNLIFNAKNSNATGKLSRILASIESTPDQQNADQRVTLNKNQDKINIYSEQMHESAKLQERAEFSKNFWTNVKGGISQIRDFLNDITPVDRGFTNEGVYIDNGFFLNLYSSKIKPINQQLRDRFTDGIDVSRPSNNVMTIKLNGYTFNAGLDKELTTTDIFDHERIDFFQGLSLDDAKDKNSRELFLSKVQKDLSSLESYATNAINDIDNNIFDSNIFQSLTNEISNLIYALHSDSNDIIQNTHNKEAISRTIQKINFDTNLRNNIELTKKEYLQNIISQIFRLA
jgi:hypothetical protein